MDQDDLQDKKQKAAALLAVPNPNAQIAYQEFTLDDIRDQLSVKACFARAGLEYDEKEFENTTHYKRRGTELQSIAQAVAQKKIDALN